MIMQEGYSIEEYIDENDLKSSKNSGFLYKIKLFLESRYFWTLIIVLSLCISFFLGRISVAQNKAPVRVLNKQEIKGQILGADTQDLSTDQKISSPVDVREVEVVASKNGTKYHYLWCAGAKQISEKNKIVFKSIDEAKKAGYSPASNCKGLK